MKVNAGDRIHATVKTIECSSDSCDWIVEARVGDKFTILPIYKEKLLMLFVIAGALEVYDYTTLKSPTDPELYPTGGSTAFTNIQLRTLNDRRFRADWNGRWQHIGGLSVQVTPDLRSVTLNYPMVELRTAASTTS